MSGGTLSRDLRRLPEQLADAITERRNELPPLLRQRLENLMVHLEEMEKLVDMTDRYLSGDISAQTFNFEWTSVTRQQETDDA